MNPRNYLVENKIVPSFNVPTLIARHFVNSEVTETYKILTERKFSWLSAEMMCELI